MSRIARFSRGLRKIHDGLRMSVGKNLREAVIVLPDDVASRVVHQWLAEPDRLLRQSGPPFAIVQAPR
jgi:hypothetical protein